MTMSDRQTLRSFRDPDGQLEEGDEAHLIRHLSRRGQLTLALVQQSRAIRDFQSNGRWIPAHEVKGDPARILHPRIFFPSYPHEWSAIMLHRAAELTLEINTALLAENLELKDASPSNILFNGHRALFVDHLSPKSRDPVGLGWGAFGQFCRTFLIPLFLHQRRGIPLAWMFTSARDGVPPDRALPILSLGDRLSMLGLNLVVFPHLFSKRAAASATAPRGTSPSLAMEVNRRMLKSLGRSLAKLKPSLPKSSQWSDYQDLGISYTTDGVQAKDAFVRSALEAHRPTAVLDLGCNTGRYAVMAARAGARVVAMDSDPACIERLFLQAEQDSLDLQPVVMDLGRPSSRLGWNGLEERALADRLAGRFDMVFALALVHHLLVRERIPLDSVIEFLAASTTRWAVVEWVEQEDPQFQRLAGPHRDLYLECRPDHFEEALTRHFFVEKSMRIPNSMRHLYLVEKK